MGAFGLQSRIEPLELDAGIRGGEAPIDGGGSIIALLLPTRHLMLKLFTHGDAARAALPSQRSEFDLGHVEPAAMQRPCPSGHGQHASAMRCASCTPSRARARGWV